MASALGLVVLASCGKSAPEAEVTGSPTMPVEFGRVVDSTHNCPVLEGLYAWPWVQGQPFGYRTPTIRDKYGSFAGIPLHDEAQIWVEGPVDSTGLLTLRSRMVNRNPNLRIRTLTEDWGYVEHNANEYECSKGWVEIAETPVDGDSVSYWFGGQGAKVSTRLATMEDGSLVVGQKLRVWGRTRSIAYGDTKGVTFSAPDRVRWYWTRLARTGPTGRGVPAMDAGPADTRVMIEVPK